MTFYSKSFVCLIDSIISIQTNRINVRLIQFLFASCEIKPDKIILLQSIKVTGILKKPINCILYASFSVDMTNSSSS
jgi:hypothetical protein